MAQARSDTWYYFNERGEQVGPLTREDLDRAAAAGAFDEVGQVYNPSLRLGPLAEQGIPYISLRKLDFTFRPGLAEFLETRSSRPLTVLAGPNNVGKTLLLKFLCAEHGPGAYMLGCNRFYHVSRLSASAPQPEDQLYRNFAWQFYAEQQNTENNALNLAQVITQLTDSGRKRLFELCGNIIGAEFSIRRVDPENEFSERYVTIDEEELGVSSTGTRLLMLLLGACLDESIHTLLVDEPELGLSPATQSEVAHYLQSPEVREEFFPHLRNVFLATHSHLFLDRSNLGNNFIVEKAGTQVMIRLVESIAEFHDLQFKLLGNRLESLFLPSAVLIVEGPSDHTFLSRFVRLFPWGQHVAVVKGDGDGGVLRKLHTIREALGDLQRSPYRQRVICVLDQRHSARLDRFANAGVPAERCIVWSKNGIEYYYPRDVLRSVFSCGDDALEPITIDDDAVVINGIRKSKSELAKLVAAQMRRDSEFGTELLSLAEVVKRWCDRAEGSETTL